jgi:UDP-N-acetylmuramate dehydrogenase
MTITVRTDVPLKNYVTMHIGGNARFMADIHSYQEITQLAAHAQQQNLPIFVLGGGSNTLVHDEGYPGIVLRNRIAGFEVIDEAVASCTIKVGAGENWDDTVKRAVNMNLTGIECLSAIPGTAGAAPVQNIGAYGQEISDTLVSLDAIDLRTNQLVTMSNSDCHFAYRDSIFRNTAIDRYVIVSITLQLYRSPPKPPFYSALQEYLDANNTGIITPKVIRDGVMAIRAEKLPDPKLQPNTGSFFKNAIVEGWQLTQLRTEYPDVPAHEMSDGKYKIPTGWLIEQSGLKGKRMHGMKIHDKNALVLINESAQSYRDLAAARNEIINIVRDKFHIQIEQEPLEMGHP